MALCLRIEQDLGVGCDGESAAFYHFYAFITLMLNLE